MSAEHNEHSETDTSTRQPALRAASLSALEEAMRQALQSASREQVLERVLIALSDDDDDNDDSTSGFQSKVQKVSVSMPAELTEAVRRRTGTGGFSRYVSDAVQQRIRYDLMDEFLDEMDAKYGPIPPEFEEEARLLWPDESL